MAAIKKIEEKLDIPEGVTVRVDGRKIHAKGPKGELEKIWVDQKIKVKVEGNEMLFIADQKPTKREKKAVNTLRAHTRNMLEGVGEGFLYRLKICSGHFPMNVTVTGNEFAVKNFIGEKTPRKFRIPAGVKVTVQTPEVSVEGADIEKVAQTAANIEQLTRRSNYDKRIFQDGIYIIEKAAKK